MHTGRAADVVDSLSGLWRDTSAGSLRTTDGSWSINVNGVTTDAEVMANWPVLSSSRPGVSARLQDVARIEQSRGKAVQYASSNGLPAISMAITKKSGTNTLALVDRPSDYVNQKNASISELGLSLTLSDDQTVPTKKALGVMETNALVGAVMVLAVSWLFLGWKVGLLVALTGVPHPQSTGHRAWCSPPPQRVSPPWTYQAPEFSETPTGWFSAATAAE